MDVFQSVLSQIYGRASYFGRVFKSLIFSLFNRRKGEQTHTHRREGTLKGLQLSLQPGKLANPTGC